MSEQIVPRPGQQDQWKLEYREDGQIAIVVTGAADMFDLLKAASKGFDDQAARMALRGASATESVKRHAYNADKCDVLTEQLGRAVMDELH